MISYCRLTEISLIEWLIDLITILSVILTLDISSIGKLVLIIKQFGELYSTVKDIWKVLEMKLSEDHTLI